VAPSAITNQSDANNFTISGAGHISGSASIVKSGISTLAINTANTFSGAVDVLAGTLITGNGAALGNTTGGTIVHAGATLDINAQNLGGEAITISSNGVGGIGALVNNGGGQAQAFRQLILAADATVGGTGLLGINNSGGTASLSTGGQPFSLTKVGGNQLTLQNFTTVDVTLSNIDIQAGIIEFSGITPGMGDPNGTNIVETGAEVSFSADSVLWNKNFVFNGNGTTTTVNIGTSATTELDGPVMLGGGVVFNEGGTLLTITNTISGSGGVIKNGTAPMVLTGSTTYTGNTTVNAGALRLQGTANLSTSPNIVINAGGTLTVTGMVSSTFPLLSGNTLGGHGVVNGLLNAQAGSTVSPSFLSGATSPAGVLTVSNAITLSGKTIIELDPANGTNDVLKSGVSTITYGGTLSLTNLSTLTNGASFKIFSATSFLGSFATITPATPGVGQAWDISALNTTGTIKVKSTISPKFGSFAVTGGNVVFSGSNGTPFNQYIVLTSTNLALVGTNWTRIATNTFDLSGNFAITNSLATPPVPGPRFYLLQLP
jgi:autotransporter-associated beta strand protein